MTYIEEEEQAMEKKIAERAKTPTKSREDLGYMVQKHWVVKNDQSVFNMKSYLGELEGYIKSSNLALLDRVDDTLRVPEGHIPDEECCDECDARNRVRQTLISIREEYNLDDGVTRL